MVNYIFPTQVFKINSFLSVFFIAVLIIFSISMQVIQQVYVAKD